MYIDVGRKIKFVRAKMFDYTQDYMAKKLGVALSPFIAKLAVNSL